MLLKKIITLYNLSIYIKLHSTNVYINKRGIFHKIILPLQELPKYKK